MDERLDVPAGVCLVLSDLSSVHVYENSVFLEVRASHPLGLRVGVKLVAVDAEVEFVLVLVDQLVEFVHEYL